MRYGYYYFVVVGDIRYRIVSTDYPDEFENKINLQLLGHQKVNTGIKELIDHARREDLLILKIDDYHRDKFRSTPEGLVPVGKYGF